VLENGFGCDACLITGSATSTDNTAVPKVEEDVDEGELDGSFSNAVSFDHGCRLPLNDGSLSIATDGVVVDADDPEPNPNSRRVSCWTLLRFVAETASVSTDALSSAAFVGMAVSFLLPKPMTINGDAVLLRDDEVLPAGLAATSGADSADDCAANVLAGDAATFSSRTGTGVVIKSAEEGVATAT
jgi:hypothetical protein